MKKNRLFLYFILTLTFIGLFPSCATFSVQKGKAVQNTDTLISHNEKVHEFILVGDAGNADTPQAQSNLNILKQRLAASGKNATLLFLGDNIYPSGMPDSLSPDRKKAESKIDKQIELANAFKGKTYFIAGNHDWYNGLKGLQLQKEYVAAKLHDKKAFMPRKYEAIDKIDINDSLVVITIDSEWFIQNWDDHPNINEESTIKTREDFFEEFRSLVNKNQNKITLVAIHHPLMTNGSHGGYFSWRSHLYPYRNIPLPVLGTMVNYLRKTTGASPADMQYTYYRNMVQRISTIVQDQPQVIFISGHEHNLQYIETKGIKQIISGSASKTEEARALQPVSFSAGKRGYAILSVYQNQEADVRFFTTENGTEEMLFHTDVLKRYPYTKAFSKINDSLITSSVYPETATRKSGFYRMLFGEHYRKVFSTPIQARVADLDTLYGGLTPLISGGGNQSMSLRLVDKNGKQYVMRGLRKSATQFLQSALFKDVYIKDKVADMYVLDFIDDFYTTSHPYVPFITGHLMDAVQLYHSNPKLFYIPKQPALGSYNASYGNELYMIEERQHKSQKDLNTFGKPDDIISTTDLLANLEKDEKYSVDTKTYLRARMLDMLIGDWDRHADQWRWAAFKKDNGVVYQPIPRDRDQVFAKIDGSLLSLIKKLPPLRHMQNYSSDFAPPRWINKTAFPLDKVILQSTTENQWEEAAQYVAEQISDEKLEEAFDLLPPEVRNLYTADIRKIVQQRRKNLVHYSKIYYDALMKYGVVVGTNKKDLFKITTSFGELRVEHFRDKKTGMELTGTYHYKHNPTKEVWIYGLDDDDRIEVSGEKSGMILRLIGGKNHDSYVINSANKIKLYDYASKKSTIDKGENTRVILRDNYQLNQYDYRHAPISTLSVLPDVGYNPDNGFMLGFNASLTKQKFIYEPFSEKHQLRTKIDFATGGAMAQYIGRFKNNSRNWHYAIEALATTSNYSQNFFGWGNDTNNYADDLGLDYYRVRTEQFSIKPSYNYSGRNGSSFSMGPTYESTEIERTSNRFIDQKVTAGKETYHTQHYAGARFKYEFKNFDNEANPALGLAFLLDYGFRTNTDDFNQNHQYLTSKLNIRIPLNASQSIVLSSSWAGKTIIGSHYHFYQAADLGAHAGLRGYRQNRFVGKSAFVTSNDVRFRISDIPKGIIPMTYGAYIGFDYGRVWQPGIPSNTWHNSYGAGIWLNAFESFVLNAGGFKSKEDFMFNFGLGFHF